MSAHVAPAARPRPALPCLSLALLLVLAAPAVRAAARRPATVLDVGLSSQCAFHTLAAALAAAQPGDTIRMQSTTFTLSPLTIDLDLTIAGGYRSADPDACLRPTATDDTTLVLAPGWTGKTLWIQASTVDLSGLTFDGNATGGGGLIVSDGVLDLGYVRVGDTNGSLTVARSIATLSHCTFSDNDADTFPGGAIYAFGPATEVTLTNVDLQGNHAASGGAIMLDDGAHLLAVDCLIAGNEAEEGGGLYVTESAVVTLRSTVVQGNSGWQRGAGASVRAGARLSAEDGTRFVHNETVYGCDEGGGIYAGDPGTQITLDATEVMTNSALLRGGGLYVGGGAGATLGPGTVVWNNEALDPTQGDGAGAYIAGGASRLDAVSAGLIDNWAANNGGGLYNDGGTVTLDQVTLTGNHAAVDGGGLYNDGGAVTGQGLWLGANVAHAGRGGGLAGVLGAVTLGQSVLYFNTALAGDGGALAVDGTELAVARSYIHHNSAAGRGSAVFVLGDGRAGRQATRLYNNLLVDNETPGSAAGSDVYVERASAILRHNTHHRHEPDGTAVYGGAGSVVLLTDSIIANFGTGIGCPVGALSQVEADYTLYHDNGVDYAACVDSTHHVYGDPLFVAPGNYHLATGSPAIDAGADAWLSEDYDGQPRPMGAGFDIGADEFVPPVFLPLVSRGR